MFSFSIFCLHSIAHYKGIENGAKKVAHKVEAVAKKTENVVENGAKKVVHNVEDDAKKVISKIGNLFG